MNIRRNALLFTLLFCFLGGMAQNDNLSLEQLVEVKQKAKSGDVNACLTLAHHYFSSNVGIWREKSVRLYHIAAEKGNPFAFASLGYCYYEGIGVNKDLSKSIEYYEKAANRGIAVAQYSLGKIFLSEKKDYELAFKWFTKADENEFIGAKTKLGEMYLEGKGIPKDIVKAKNLFELDAAENHTLALYHLGKMYHYGEGVQRDCTKALDYYKKIENENQEVLIAIGEIYEDGECMRKDTQKAIDYYKKASEWGESLGEYKLGNIYYEQHKWVDAFEQLKLASEDEERPIPAAMRLLSACYKYGRGTNVDMEKGQYWQNEAAKHKDVSILELLSLKHNSYPIQIQ